jgi:hypothetical protein
MKVNENVADRNQDGVTAWRKTQGSYAAEVGWYLFEEAKAHYGCRADDNDYDNDL